MFPRWGTLLTYGNALVMSTFRLPGCGRIGLGLFCESAMAAVSMGLFFRTLLRKFRRTGAGTGTLCCDDVLLQFAKVGQWPLQRCVEAGLPWSSVQFRLRGKECDAALCEKASTRGTGRMAG